MHILLSSLLDEVHVQSWKNMIVGREKGAREEVKSKTKWGAWEGGRSQLT